MTRLALYLQDAHTITEAISFAQYAEERGFEAVWQADSRLVREASVPMAAFAATTERIKIGSGVIDVWSRNPARLASMFSTLDDLAPGRILCGLGAWWDPLAAKVGIDRAKPLTVMREVVTVVRQLLANENVTFHGEYVHVDGIELDYVYQERRPKDVPIYIGATGMKMMELDRRDRRRRGAQLPRLARLQRPRPRRPRRRCRARRAHRRRHRPAAARRVLGATTTGRRRSTWRATW